MSKLLPVAAYAAGAATLFCGAFLAFAVSSGEPLDQVAGLSLIVPPGGDGPPPPAHATPADAAAARAREREERVASHASVLGVFQVPSPLSNSALRRLADELSTELASVRRVSAELREREATLGVREEALEERFAELDRLRARLDEMELELGLRLEEVRRDEEAQSQRERASWARVATSFETGDAAELAARLTTFQPEEAALVLRELDDERAAALIQALPQAVYRDYVDAYRRVEP